MIGAYVAFFVLLGQAPVPQSNPTALVAQLGAARYAEREAAAGALERLGREALPALRAAQTSKDAEVKSRASSLLQRIEGALLTQPTMVRLDFENKLVAEVVKDISEQSGIKLGLFPENMPAWQNLRLTLHESSPLPFWKAIDRLCDEGHFSYNPAIQAMPQGREPALQLSFGGARPPGPISDQGPFRVTLLSLHYQHDVSFLQGGTRAFALPPGAVPPAPFPVAPVLPKRATPPGAGRIAPQRQPGAGNGPNHAVTNQFYAQLQVAAEPRLALSQNGPLKLVEAIDDRGQSLVLPPSTGALTHRASGYFGLTQGSVTQIQAPLHSTTKPTGVIKKLRGVIPLSVATRKPNPLAVTLAAASGKTFQNDDVTLNVLDVKTNPATHQTNIDLSIRTTEPPGNSPTVAEFVYHRPDMHQQQIEIVDTLGRPIPWYHSSFDAEGSRMTLTLTPPDQTITPSQLRYYGLARAATEVNFEFSDVPMD